MNERYDPTGLIENTVRAPEEMIQAFFDEFPWLEAIAAEFTPARYRKTYVVSYIRVALVHQRVVSFIPLGFVSLLNLNTVINNWVKNKEDDHNVYMSWYVINDEEQAIVLPVGSKKKWKLVCRPRWFAPWRKWKVEWKEVQRAERVGQAIKRVCPHPEKIRRIVEVFVTRQKHTSLPEVRIAIFKVPKEYTLHDWIKKDEEMRIQELQAEVKVKVGLGD